MLQISILGTTKEPELKLEGRLVAPWTTELARVYEDARTRLGDRQLLTVDLCNLTAIDADGERVLLELLGQGARFRSSGAFTRHVLKQLARKVRPCNQEKR